MKDAAYWEKRFREAESAWHGLKNHTKNIKATEWSKDYRELAEMIHSLGRDVFYVDFLD
jgi:hypothetical protein